MTDLQKYEAAMAEESRRYRRRRTIAIIGGILLLAGLVAVCIFARGEI